ncbi:MAG TPA: hypothetical protein VNN22_02650 [Verrucomicrobiae bacterium]|nr:hypothetical protein [Verrucomicrobiae bacterium]
MIPELPVPAEEATLLVKPLGGHIISRSNDRHHIHVLAPEPAQGGQNKIFSNAPTTGQRTDTDQTDLPLPTGRIPIAGNISHRLIGLRSGHPDMLGTPLSIRSDPSRIEVFRPLSRKICIFEKTRILMHCPSDRLQSTQITGLKGPETNAYRCIGRSRERRIIQATLKGDPDIHQRETKFFSRFDGDRVIRPGEEIQAPNLMTAVPVINLRTCSSFSVSRQTRAMRQWKNSVSHGSNSQGATQCTFMY